MFVAFSLIFSVYFLIPCAFTPQFASCERPFRARSLNEIKISTIKSKKNFLKSLYIVNIVLLLFSKVPIGIYTLTTKHHTCLSCKIVKFCALLTETFMANRKYYRKLHMQDSHNIITKLHYKIWNPVGLRGIRFFHYEWEK